METGKISAEHLRQFEPLRSLSTARLDELAALCLLEVNPGGVEPILSRGIARQLVYLFRGTLELTLADGSKRLMDSDAEDSQYPLGQRVKFDAAKSLTDVALLRIDDELLDLMATWDQVSRASESMKSVGIDATLARTDWGVMSGAFSVQNLKFGALAQLPPAHIEQLLARFAKIKVVNGQVIVQEGTPGDYYYLIESGKCKVERLTGGVSMLLAQLKSGDAFGEEALVADVKRNATVTMTTDGVLLRLEREDFVALLKQPLLHRVSMDEARRRVAAGAQWLDVRFPSEFQYDKLPGAINIPFSEIRNALGVLNQDREYVVYCQSERRSAAAAFLFAQRGYQASVLAGGLWGENRLSEGHLGGA